MTPRDTSEAFTLGCWDVYPSENRLIDGSRVVSLEPRVMSVLVCMARTPARIISIDEFLDLVWDGHAHGDHTVYQAIADLRKALGDDAHSPKYIETIPKRGYRLLAPVGRLSQAPDSVGTHDGDVRRKTRVTATLFASLLVLVAVATLGLYPNDRARVTDQTTDNPQVRAYDHFQIGMNLLSRRSGIGHGSVAAAEFRRAIDIDPTFARAYTGLAEVLYRQNLQAAIASGMSHADSAAEIPEDVESLLKKAMELAPALPDTFVLRGRMAEDRRDMEAAESNYRMALQAAELHIGALQGLASILREQYRFAEARQQLDKALALEPRNPALLFDVMHLLDDAAEYDELLRFSEHAAAVNPDSASIFLWLNRYYSALGQPDRSVSLLAPLIGDPRFLSERPVILSALTAAFLSLGELEAVRRYDEWASQHGDRYSLSSMRALLVLDRRDEFVHAVHSAAETMPLPWSFIAHLETLVGHWEHALPIIESAMTQGPWDPTNTDVLVEGWQPSVTAAQVLKAAGEQQRARDLLFDLRPSLEDATEDPRRRSGAYYFLAAIELLEGNEDAAINQLERAADSGWTLHWLIDHDPAFTVIRESGDFQRIVNSVRQRMDLLRQNLSSDEIFIVRDGLRERAPVNVN